MNIATLSSINTSSPVFLEKILYYFQANRNSLELPYRSLISSGNPSAATPAIPAPK